MNAESISSMTVMVVTLWFFAFCAFAVYMGCRAGQRRVAREEMADKLWHETARIAIEKGQPIPERPGPFEKFAAFAVQRKASVTRPQNNDFRAGLFFMAIGIGIWAGGGEYSDCGALPFCVGVAFLALFFLGVAPLPYSKRMKSPDAASSETPVIAP